MKNNTVIRRGLIVFAAVLFFLLISSQKTLAQTCTPVFPATTCDVTNSVSITAVVPETTVTFSGFAPGSSIVYFKEGEFIIGSAVTDTSGVFNKTITSTADTHTIQIYLIDTQGRTTPTVTLPIFSLTNHNDLQISNIHLPPTISVTKTTIQQGQIVSIFGQGSPGSKVDIYVNNVKKFVANIGSDSKWQFDLNGGGLADQNTFYGISVRSGIADSEKSQAVSLEVLACLESDCSRVNPKPETATPSATTNKTTSEPSKKVDYIIKLEIGRGLRDLILMVIITISLIISLITFFIFLMRRRKKKKRILEELERKVKADIQTPNPIPSIEKDFSEAEKEIS